MLISQRGGISYLLVVFALVDYMIRPDFPKTLSKSAGFTLK